MDLITSELEVGTTIEEIAPVLKVSRIATIPGQPGQNAVVHGRRRGGRGFRRLGIARIIEGNRRNSDCKND